MPEMYPVLHSKLRVISVVICRNGYQAMVEETVDINFHPYCATITRTARGPTVCEAIKAAVIGKQLRMRQAA